MVKTFCLRFVLVSMKYIWNINVTQSFQGRYGEIYAHDYYGGSPELFPRGEIHIYNNYFDNRRKNIDISQLFS